MKSLKFFFLILMVVSYNPACGQEDKKQQNEGESVMIIDLPKPVITGKISLEESLNKRRSVREFSNKPLTVKEVSQILWAAYGITKPIADAPAFVRSGLRTAPSAGALYPLELYILAGNVEDISPGIYQYDSENHSLKLVKVGDKRKELSSAALSQKAIEMAPVTIIYSAIFERTTGKYGQRGRDRYVCIDLGHSAQNLCLQATALSLGVCTIGAFNDEDVKKVVGMTKDEEAMYLLPVGR
ncbi:MAG: SagB/ThcOx family dehydrogenase [bacterium]